MIRHYHLSTKDREYFSVNFQDMGGDPTSRDANEFDAKAESSISVTARERGERVIQVHVEQNTLSKWRYGSPLKTHGCTASTATLCTAHAFTRWGVVLLSITRKLINRRAARFTTQFVSLSKFMAVATQRYSVNKVCCSGIFFDF